MEYKANTPPYRPQCNGKIEGFHKYLKSCTAKLIVNNMEWDEFTDLATVAYNFVPKCNAKRSHILSHVWKRSIHATESALVTIKAVLWYG